MPSNPELDNVVFGIFAQRQDAQQAAQALVYSTVAATVAKAIGANLNTGRSRAFQLILSPSTPASTGSQLTNAAGSAVGSASQANRGAGAPVSTITLDVAPASNVNGFAQRVNYELHSRQSVQNTLIGFHVNEFGQAPGHLDVDCIVTWSASPNSDISAFFKLLETAKKTFPTDTTPPYQLLFVDSFLGLTLTITQESVSLEQSSDMQNMGRLRISATVLYDANSTTPPSPALTNIQKDAQAALNALRTLTSLT